MKLTEEKKQEILKLRQTVGEDGKPLTYDAISDITGVSKPYVLGVCALAPGSNTLNGVTEESAKAVMAPVTESRAIVENGFLHQRIKDLEDSQRSLKSELNGKVEKLHSLQMDYNKLKVDFDTLEVRKDAEVEKKLLMAQFDNNKGLGGLINDDKKFDRTMRVLEMGLAKLSANSNSQNNTQALPQNQNVPVHPLLNDAEVGNEVKEIYAVLPAFKKQDIPHLYALLATFFVDDTFLEKVSKKAVETVNASQAN